MFPLSNLNYLEKKLISKINSRFLIDGFDINIIRVIFGDTICDKLLELNIKKIGTNFVGKEKSNSRFDLISQKSSETLSVSNNDNKNLELHRLTYQNDEYPYDSKYLLKDKDGKFCQLDLKSISAHSSQSIDEDLFLYGETNKTEKNKLPIDYDKFDEQFNNPVRKMSNNLELFQNNENLKRKSAPNKIVDWPIYTI